MSKTDTIAESYFVKIEETPLFAWQPPPRDHLPLPPTPQTYHRIVFHPRSNLDYSYK